MKQVEFVIDIGSKYVNVFKKDAGLIIREMSLVAICTEKGKLTLIESGKRALEYKEMSNVQVIYPVKDGYIFYPRAAVLMFKDLFKRAIPRTLIKPKVRVIACISCGLSNTEKNDIENVLNEAGASEVVILESPLAVAELIGGNEKNHLIIDMGASKTEIAIVDKTGIIQGASINIGGDMFNQAISDYITDTYRQQLSLAKIERIKKEIGTLSDKYNAHVVEESRSIHGDAIQQLKLSSREIKLAISPLVDKIIKIAINMICQLPPEKAEKVVMNGVYVCGGSSRIVGLNKYFEEQFECEVNIISDPECAVVNGGAVLLNMPSRLNALLGI